MNEIKIPSCKPAYKSIHNFGFGDLHDGERLRAFLKCRWCEYAFTAESYEEARLFAVEYQDREWAPHRKPGRDWTGGIGDV